jgi:hypothetical protein
MKTFKNLLGFTSKLKDRKAKLIPFTEKVEKGLNLCIDHLDDNHSVTNENVYGSSVEGNGEEIENMEKQVIAGTLTLKQVSSANPRSTATCIKNIISSLDPPLLSSAHVSRIMEPNANIEALLSELPQLPQRFLDKFLTHCCDIADSSSSAVTFHDLASTVGVGLFGPDVSIGSPVTPSSAATPTGALSTRTISSDFGDLDSNPFVQARVSAVEKLLAYRSHIMHGRPASTFDVSAGTTSPKPTSSHNNVSSASNAAAEPDDGVIVESILDRSVKITFPKKKKKKGEDGDDADHEPPMNYEDHLRDVLAGFDDVVNVSH